MGQNLLLDCQESSVHLFIPSSHSASSLDRFLSGSRKRMSDSRTFGFVMSKGWRYIRFRHHQEEFDHRYSKRCCVEAMRSYERRPWKLRQESLRQAQSGGATTGTACSKRSPSRGAPFSDHHPGADRSTARRMARRVSAPVSAGASIAASLACCIPTDTPVRN